MRGVEFGVSASSCRRRLNGGAADATLVAVGCSRLRRRRSLCSSRVVLYRLCSILLSYIRRRSRTLAFEKSFRAIRPRVRSGRESDVSSCGKPKPFRPKDLARLANGPVVFFSFIASIVWFWIRSARFRRHERLTMRSARIDSIGLRGASSARRASRWRSKSAWLSEVITSWRADRPCFRAFCETTALP